MKTIWRMTADLVSQTLFVTYADSEPRSFPLYGREAFEALSWLWLKAGWANKYTYNFSWLGRAVIQLPEDLMMLQEVICRVRPDVVIETGVAHGGGTVFYASLMELLGHGRVIGVDIEIRPDNRRAIENHPLAKRITLIERSSTDPQTLHEIKQRLGSDQNVLVVLDSNHSKAHVLHELRMYSPLVSSGSYIVATDGNMHDLHDLPGGKPEWCTDNPRTAVHEFLQSHPEFEIDSEPTRLGVTYWPDAYLRRK